VIGRRYSMSRTFHHQRGKVSVKNAKKRKPAELRRIARALIALALAEAEQEAAARADDSAERQDGKPKRGAA
jgi:hypothetical protein